MSAASPEAEAGPQTACRAPRWLLLAGFGIALLGSVCGIGGGLFAVPLLHFALGFPLRRAVATSLCLVFTTTTTATVAESLHSHSQLNWPLIGVLAGGALVGAQLGYSLSRRIRMRQLRILFTAVLFGAGLRILTADGSSDAVLDGAAFTLGGKQVVTALAIGLGGGVLAPLLGVGGGLLMVPGLFLLLPEIGYLGARAASLAVGSLTALRSLSLLAGERLVDWRAGRLLALGSLAGSLAGALLVHRPGWGAYAQVAMGLILLFVALRFLIDAMRDTG